MFFLNFVSVDVLYWDAQLICFGNFPGHAGTDPVTAHPQFITPPQKLLSKPEPKLSLGGITIVQHLRVQKVDRNWNISLVVRIAAGSLREGYIFFDIAGIRRGNIDQLAFFHFAAAPTV